MASDYAVPLFNFVGTVKELTTDEARKEALGRYAVLDDGWCFQGLRNLQKTTKTPLLSACLAVALDREPKLKSIWKRKGDLSREQFDTLRERIRELTSTGTGKLRLQEVRRRLIDRVFCLHSFNSDRTLKTGLPGKA